MVPLPKYDERTANEIAQEVRGLLSAADWPLQGGSGLEEALIRVFARFSELVIHRLNLAPEKNYLAFLDLLGLSQLPMQAARAALTFSMAPGSATCARVPAGTQVAAAPGPGQQKPIVFETERELIVTPARLDCLLVKFGARDTYRDLNSALLPPAEVQLNLTPAPSAELAIPHLLYISVPARASWPQIDRLTIRFAVSGAIPAADARLLQWEMPVVDIPPLPTNTKKSDAAGENPTIVLAPTEDGTKNLSQSGNVVFLNLPKVSPVVINGVAGNWIACRLLTPITPGTDPKDGMVRAAQLPTLAQIACTAELARKDLALDEAFYNAQKLDLSKDFLPFGERPRFGDVFYLGSGEVFSDPDARIVLDLELTDAGARKEEQGSADTPDHDLQLSWEFWNGQEWRALAKSRLLHMEGDPSETELEDGTDCLRKSGEVKLKFSSAPQETIVNGQKKYWVRVRIAAGNYGGDARFDRGPAGLVAVPATLAPPSIKALRVDYAIKNETAPAAVLTYNDFSFDQVHDGACKPFVPVADSSTSAFVGFAVDPSPATKPAAATNSPEPRARNGKFPSQTVTAYVHAGDGAAASVESVESNAIAGWEYWDGSAWRKLFLHDETEKLRRSGLIQFLPPPDFAPREEFAKERYWLKLRLGTEFAHESIQHIFLNTTMALQGLSVANDMLGSSNGKVSQRFKTIQSTVLAGQVLKVREPNLPAFAEREQIEADEGEDAIKPVKDAATKTDQYWVRWHEVPNFYSSGPRDRHYLLDHVTGEITFGDGSFGLIPPRLPGNIRMTRYRSGGGLAGNQAALAIGKLNTAVPYIQKVVNYLPSGGGSDPEQTTSLLERGSRGVRHGGRAVTCEDFEDLAMLGSPDVARAKCVPLFDLSPGQTSSLERAGVVSVIVLPRSIEPKPMPSSDLLDRVRDFLDTWRLPTLELIVTGPKYVRVHVAAEIAVREGGNADEVETAVRLELQNYLHPVTGGPDGLGWEFGRAPQKFDLSLRVERIPGVSHVRDITVNLVPDMPGVERTSYFSVCPGDFQIAVVLEEQCAIEFA